MKKQAQYQADVFIHTVELEVQQLTANWSEGTWQDATERLLKESEIPGVRDVTIWNRGKAYAKPHFIFNPHTYANKTLKTLKEHCIVLQEIGQKYGLNLAYHRIDVALSFQEPFNELEPQLWYLADIFQTADKSRGHPANYLPRMAYKPTQIGWKCNNGLAVIGYNKDQCDKDTGGNSGYQSRIEFRKIFGRASKSIGEEPLIISNICQKMEEAKDRTEQAIQARTAAFIEEFEGRGLKPKDLAAIIKWEGAKIYSRQGLNDIYQHFYPQGKRQKITDWMKRHGLSLTPYNTKDLIQWVYWMQGKLHQFGETGVEQ